MLALHDADVAFSERLAEGVRDKSLNNNNNKINNYAFLTRHKSNVNDLRVGAISPQET